MTGSPISLPGGTARSWPLQPSIVIHAAILGAVIFLAALFGIVTRPAGHLASFWPANALLLGLMARDRRFATPPGWVSAIIGYLAADLVTGSAIVMTLLLTGANLAGVAAGYWLLMRLDPVDRRLGRPAAVLHLCLVSCGAAAAAGMIGALVAPILFNMTLIQGWVFWFVADLINYVALLPAILTAPGPRRLWQDRRRVRLDPGWRTLGRIAPMVTLGLSCIAGIVIGGPGAVAFPVPALLWCALTYQPFTTAVLTLLFGIWALLAIADGRIHALPGDALHTLLSIRLGVTLMALAPITVASATAVRNELLHRLQHVADHDQLTGLLNRSGFTARYAALMRHLTAQRRPVAMLMIDIDHFKTINDRFGHAGGDQVLQVFAARVQACLRDTDVFGRLGGEEFGILLPDCRREEAEGIAERIRAAFADETIDLKDGGQLSATASVGLVFATPAPSDAEAMLLAADKALYRAKEAGRNRVEGEAFAAR